MTDSDSKIYRADSVPFYLYYRNNKTGLQIQFPTDFQLNWTGPYTLTPFIGRCILTLNATVPVGTYTVMVTANATHHQPASYYITMTITQAPTYLNLIEERIDRDRLYQGDSIGFSVFFNNTYGEEITNADVYFRLNVSGSTTIRKTGTLTHIGAGIYSVDFTTWELGEGDYDIEIYAVPTDTNYSQNVNSLVILSVHIRSMFVRPIFIVLYIIAACAVAVVAYRQVRWYLTPYQVKEIIRAKKKIKKNKMIEETKVVRDREEMFASEFKSNWAIIGIKPPKLVKPEIVAFANELTAILRSRITSSEAEVMINQLRVMEISEAETYLASLKVPPEASRRLLAIIGMIEKERLEIIGFAQALSAIKAMEITYSQAEEIIITLRSLTYHEADRYLEAMVIPAEDRKELLDFLEIEPPYKPPEFDKGKKKKKK